LTDLDILVPPMDKLEVTVRSPLTLLVYL